MANDNQIAFLCSRLKELREKNGCTMDDMAKKIDVLEGLKPGTGMNKSSISRVEGGKTAEKTLLEMARKYCKVFGMSESQTEQFLRGEKVAVPDTSALLKNSQLIDELNKEYSKVVIPKVVVDELDNIKNKNSGSLGRKAWEVIRGISYGSRTILMPCAGKSTLMDRITDAKVINGSQELRRICGGSFLELSEEEKHQVRIKYTEYINGLNDEVIVSDGHYSFMETVAFTEADGELYDIFIYLYCSPENLKERYALSEKNGKFAGESIESLRQWQEFEINNLREECHRRNKDFYVVSDNEEEQNKFFDFLSLLREGFSSYDLATDICNQIMEQFNKQDILYMVDGDKTIIIQDSYRFCCNGKTKIFDGDFYTGYQSFLFEKELQTASIDKSKIAEITINNEVYDIVASNNYVVLSSGIKDLWSDIANAKNLGTIFASPYISADVKYYVVKQLREHGYTIFAYGDSKIDLYMLREADKGFLYIGKRISRSLKNESLSGLVPIYDHSLVILADEDEEVQADIAICKSNSGISGSRLAAAHVRLGEKIGRHIAAVFPEKNTSILVLERGGRFFGDGVYMGAGGIFYSMNPKQDDAPVINTERVVIVDSVINTGKSIMRIIDELKNHNPGIDVIIAANVIQNEAVELFKDYLVFATRLSKNSFVGVNQSKQTGKTGPDTADRLFNLIKKRY